jgi:hypothetical protein
MGVLWQNIQCVLEVVLHWQLGTCNTHRSLTYNRLEECLQPISVEIKKTIYEMMSIVFQPGGCTTCLPTRTTKSVDTNTEGDDVNVYLRPEEVHRDVRYNHLDD